jgi:hypothetical protein
MITIQEVKTKNELKQFIRYPRQLYKNCPYFVPEMESEEYKMLTAHPALSFCTLRLWIAYKDGKIAGRIGGIINHKHNELKNKKRIRFAWFDVDNDVEIAKALFETVENWGRDENLLEISGPSRYSNMEKQGMLVEGFDALMPITSDYNYPYYPLLMDELGYEKEEDYLQMKVEVQEISERMKNLSHQLAERYGIKNKVFKNKQELLEYGKRIFEALNESFADIYNFIPLTDAEIEDVIKNNFSFADKDLVGILVDKNDQLVGFSFSIPSLSKAFRKAKGKLFPFGWYHVLKALKKSDSVNLIIQGVLPEWINSGIHALYHYQQHQTYIDKGYKYAITNQQLERNHHSRIWERYGGKFFARRRCYVKQLQPGR